MLPEWEGREAARIKLGHMNIKYDSESFLECVRNCDIVAVKLFIDVGMDPNTRSISGDPSLFLASINGNKELLELLLSEGVDVNVKNAKGQTSLHGAVISSNMDSLELLVAKGADINTFDNEGLSPIHYAKKMGQREIVEFLRECGALD